MECNAEHPLAWIVRPIARTLCDAFGLRRRTKSCATVLALMSGVLLLAAWYATRKFDQAIADLVQRYIRNYIVQQLSQTSANYLMQLVISNAVFIVFRAILWYLLYAVYELGRDVTFALILLLAAIMVSTVGAWGLLSSKAITEFVDQHQALFGVTGASVLTAAWFWKTYMLASGSGRRVFDFDIGAALSRLRPR